MPILLRDSEQIYNTLIACVNYVGMAAGIQQTSVSLASAPPSFSRHSSAQCSDGRTLIECQRRLHWLPQGDAELHRDTTGLMLPLIGQRGQFFCGGRKFEMGAANNSVLASAKSHWV